MHNLALRHWAGRLKTLQYRINSNSLHPEPIPDALSLSTGHVGAQAQLRGIPGLAGPRMETQWAVGVPPSA